MKSLLIITMLIASQYANAKTTSADCLQSTTMHVIEFLQNRQPDAELRPLRNQQDQLIGITDLAGIIPDIEITRSVGVSKNSAATYFEFDNIQIRAQYELENAVGKTSCKLEKITLQNMED